MDSIDSAIEKLKTGINSVWTKTREKLRANIFRGHFRSISTDVEDYIGLFISDILGDQFRILIDPSIYISGTGTHRPDILVVRDGRIVAMIEVKTQTGWCRDISTVIDYEILRMHKVFCNQELICKFSGDEPQKVIYDEKVKLFLVVLTSQNGAKDKRHKVNVNYANSNGIGYYILFDGWYDGLTEKSDTKSFAQELLNLKNAII